MNLKTLIIVDSSCTISSQLAKENQIVILPLAIYRNDGQTYLYESLTMDSKDFLKMSDDGYSFKTGCTPQGVIEEVLQDELKVYDQIIALPISKKWSSQYDHLKQLENDKRFANKLFVVDTLEYGYAIEKLALDLRQKLNKNMYTTKELLEYATNYHDKTISYFACLELNGLVKSGRVPKILASLLKLTKRSPIIRVEGENHLEAWVKNYSEVINKIIKATSKIYDNKLTNKDIVHIAVLTTEIGNEFVDSIITELSKTFSLNKSQIEIKAAPSIFANIVGRNAIGIHIVASKEKIKD